jgi:4-hydroxythreonine-4-phosphate dehydrogenase
MSLSSTWSEERPKNSSAKDIPRILITPGEPAGIGPDIVLKAAQQTFQSDLMVVADPGLLKERAKQLHIDITIDECDFDAKHQLHQPGRLRVYPCALPSFCRAGQLNVEHAQYVIQTLTIAARACIAKQARALVTGPVHKSIMNQAGISFSGHTEFFAEIAHVPRTVMLFVTPNMRVALATTHLPLKEVADAITSSSLQETILILNHALQTTFHISNPRLLIAGLNPHAGEGGYLGREEIDVITPTLNHLRHNGLNVIGPLPADTIFTPAYLKKADAILAMYHDQALSVVKYAGFGQAVNVTLGLPFIRSSVDHGTALPLAGTNQADPESLLTAIRLAIELAT